MRVKLFALLAVSVFAFVASAQVRGPVSGTLILTGGDFVESAVERFVASAGGPEANFVYIPTAASSLRLPSGFI